MQNLLSIICSQEKSMISFPYKLIYEPPHTPLWTEKENMDSQYFASKYLFPDANTRTSLAHVYIPGK